MVSKKQRNASKATNATPSPVEDMVDLHHFVSCLCHKHADEGVDHHGLKVLAGFDCHRWVESSDAVPPSCPKTCGHCSYQFRPLHWQEHLAELRYVSQHNDADAAAIIRSLVDQIGENLTRLHDATNDWGDTIVRRWKKRTPQKREALVLEVLPHMLRRLEDDIDVPVLHGQPRRVSRAKFRLQALLPHLDASTLSEDYTNFLALVHHRSTTTPSDWVMFDSREIDAGFACGQLAASFNPHCVVMNDETNTFGTLTPWNKRDAHAWKIIGFPRAKSILEAQHTLTGFLIGVVDALLMTGVDEASKGRSAWDALVSTDFTNADSAPSIPGRRTATYRPPSLLSLTTIQTTMLACREETRDELRLFQTDPAFAKEVLNSFNQSLQHKMEDSRTRTCHYLGLMLGGVRRLRVWDWIAKDLSDTIHVEQQMQALEEDEDPYVGEARDVYRTSLATLLINLKECFAEFLCTFVQLVMQLGTLDDVLVFFKKDEAALDTSYLHSKHIGARLRDPSAEKRDPWLYSFGRLFAHDELDRSQPTKLLTLMDRMCSPSAGKRQRQVHQIIASRFADLIALDDAIVAIELHRPLCGGGLVITEDDLAFVEDPELTAYLHTDTLWWTLGIVPEDQLWADLSQFLSSPLTSKPSEQTLYQLDECLTLLDRFWTRAQTQMSDFSLTKYTDEMTPERFMFIVENLQLVFPADEYQRQRQLEREALVAMIEAEESKERSKIKTDRARTVDLSVSPLDGPSFPETTSASPDTFDSRGHSKPKVKTRPEQPVVENARDNVEAIVENIAELNLTDDRIPVSADAWDIFHRMFVTYGKRMAGNARWEDVVKALVEAGTIPSQSAGSAVSFRNVEEGGKRTIVFHQPHDRSVNPIMLRAYGKRLAQRFGWGLDTFKQR